MGNEKIRVRYIVKNVDDSISFYKNMLNFQVDMHPAPGFAILSRDNLELLINQPGAGGAGHEMPDGKFPEPGGWNRFQLNVDNLQSLHRELKNKGLEFKNEIVEGQGGKQVLLKDPSGNLIELFESSSKREVNYIPDKYHSITPFIATDYPDDLADFIKSAFDGKVTYMMKSDDGITRHATVQIGDSLIMISKDTDLYDPVPMVLHLFVKDVDTTYQRALKFWGRSIQEPHDEFYGDRRSGIEDKWGNKWWISTHIEDLNEEQIKKREKEFRGKRKNRKEDFAKH